MSHTNETTYYGLPQYVGADIPDPLVDANGAYSTIDTALHNVAGSAGQASTDASQAVAAVEVIAATVSGHTTAIEGNAQTIQKVSDAIADTFNDSDTYASGKVVWYNGKTYQFTAPHSGAWTGLDVIDFVSDDTIAGVESSIDTINTKIGDTDISAIGDGSLTGAIDALNTDVTVIDAVLGNTDISSIGDGSVTGAISAVNSSLKHNSVTITSATKYSDLASVISNFSDDKLPYVIAKNTSNTLTFFMPLTRMQSQYSLLGFAIASNAYDYELYITSTSTELNEYTISSATTNNLIGANWDIKLYY